MFFNDFPNVPTIFFYTDCLSLLMALSSLRVRSRDAAELTILYAQLSQRAKVNLFHVRGHRGLPGNEIADHLAVRACTVGEPREGFYSKRVIRSALSDETNKHWRSDWILNNADTELFKWVPDVMHLPPDFPPPRQVVFLITGHGRFPFYLHRISLVPSSICFCGVACTSIDHFMSCAGTTVFRNQLVQTCNIQLSPNSYPAILRDRKAVDILRAMVRHINEFMSSTDALTGYLVVPEFLH